MQTKAIVFVEPIICEVFVDQITLINCESLKEIGKMAFVESARSSREQTPKSLAQNEIKGIFFLSCSLELRAKEEALFKKTVREKVNK